MALLSAFTATDFLYTFVVCLLVTLALSKWLRERKCPPGPMGVPLLGYSVFLGKKPNEKLRQLGKKYGDMFSIYLGTDLYVVVNEYNIFRDLVNKPELLFRNPRSFDFMIGRGGIGGMNGEEWQEQRRFTFYTMRNLGLGKGQWETLIKESIANLIEEMQSWKGKPTAIEDPLTNNQSNTNISLLLGRHLDPVKDAEDLKILLYSTREFMVYFSSVSFNLSMWWMRNLMETFNIFGYRRFKVLLRQFENIFIKEVKNREKSPDSLEKDDFIGCFYRELKKKEKETKNHTFTMENLIGNLLIMFIAGNDTTLASVGWLLLLMAEHQEVQKKVHEEIDNAIGRDGSVSYDDRNNFPYSMAVMYEMTRWVSIAPITAARYLSDDVEYNGYVIPKGAHVIGNLWAIMRDARHFENPHEFKPERFLSENGAKSIYKLDGYAAFSLGKRNCPGEGVAIMTMFLYFVTLMQKFKVTAPPGRKIDLEPIFGGAHMPKAQELCFTER